MAQIDDSAEVVVIGGGVIGASLAYHLAARGCRSVYVIEREERSGLGSTGRATGGFRAQFASRVNIQLSLLSRQKLLTFEGELGVDPGYRPCGYLLLAQSEEAVAELERARALQWAEGLVEVRPVDVDEVLSINPALNPSGVLGGSHCPSDGFIRPLSILEGYREGARRLGVRFAYGEPVTALDTRGARITAVRTARQTIAVGAVVNAAGAWAAEVARLAGVELPVMALRRQVASTHPTTALPEEMPLTVWLGDGFHCRMRDGRALLLQPDQPPSAERESTAVNPGWVRSVAAIARERLPGLRPLRIDRDACWAGLYEMSPDHHAIVGRAPGVENLYLANGSSGHGVMHAPALGQLVAEMLLDGRAHSIDVHALRPQRFAEADAVESPVFL